MAEKDLKAIKRKYGIIGNDPNLELALQQALTIAAFDSSVLILGENGVGKDVFAKLIHDNSERSRKKFLAINCGGLPEGTINSELFGHVKGAFTDAVADRKGYFEEVDGGTLFLDEIGNLPLSTQMMLLRVLQNGEIMPIGSNATIKVNVRIITATNVDLIKAITEKDFREDLYYRLCGTTIRVPALRDRGEDIMLLARYFTSMFATENHKFEVKFDDSAVQVFNTYQWPGNVRQLQSVVKSLTIFHGGETISKKDLNSYILPQYDRITTTGATPNYNYATDRELIFTMLANLAHEIKLLKQGMHNASSQPTEASPIGTTLALESHFEHQEDSHHIHQPTIESVPRQTGSTFHLDRNNVIEATIEEDFDKSPTFSIPAGITIEDLKDMAIEQSLKRNHGNCIKTAQELNVSERTIYRWISDNKNSSK